MNPELEVGTVAEGITDAVLKGESGHVILPGSLSFLVSVLRAMPYWYSKKVRNDAERFMSGGWRGRQVINPEEKYGSKSGTDKVET